MHIPVFATCGYYVNFLRYITLLRPSGGIRFAGGMGIFGPGRDGGSGSVSAEKKFNLDEWARQLSAAVPPGLRAVGDDLEKNFRGLLKAGLARLDLVTREEFDLQVAVLSRTRERLEALEAQLKELEKNISSD